MSCPDDAGEFVRVCGVSDLSDPGKAVVKVGDRSVALFHVAGRFWATDDRCTHDGGALVDGRLEGHTIVCPRHGARFDVRTGEVLSRPANVDLAVHEVRVEGNDVLVRMSEELWLRPGWRFAVVARPTVSVDEGELAMLQLAVTFLVIALIAAFCGFAGVAALSFEGAKILFFIFIILAVLSFVGYGFRGGHFRH
jgi:3-phenylpropionate/trans-cinnamate dioxygenase ferredoxin component